MPFTPATFDDGASSRGSGVPKFARYANSGEALATIAGATYFDGDNVFTQTMRTGDVVLVTGSDGSAFYEVTVSGTNVTLSTGLPIP